VREWRWRIRGRRMGRSTCQIGSFGFHGIGLRRWTLHGLILRTVGRTFVTLFRRRLRGVTWGREGAIGAWLCVYYYCI